MRPRLAGHVHAPRLGRADEGDAFLGGNVADVVLAACLPGKAQVALHLPPLAFGWDAGKMVGSGVGPVVDAAAAHEGDVLAVGGDDPAKAFGFEHGRAHHLLALHAAPIVGKAGHEGSHGLHVGQRPALFPAGDGPVGGNAHPRARADAGKLRIQMFAVVRHGVEVRHGAHAGEAAARRRQRAGLHRFLIRKSRFSKMHMHVDQTGKENDIRFFQHHGPGGNGNAHLHGHEAAVFQKRVRARALTIRAELSVLENKRHALTSFAKKYLPCGRKHTPNAAARTLPVMLVSRSILKILSRFPRPVNGGRKLLHTRSWRCPLPQTVLYFGKDRGKGARACP